MDAVQRQQLDVSGQLTRLCTLVDGSASTRTPTPFVPQLDDSECAAASLEAVVRGYGKRAGLARCRQAVGFHRDGASLYDLQLGAESLGFECLGVRADFRDDFDSLPLPFILSVDRHFVVVDGRAGNSARLMDPAVGRRWLSLADLTERSQGFCLLLAPGPTFHRWADERIDFSRYRRLARKHSRHLMRAVGCSLFLVAIGVAGPWLCKLTLDEVIPLADAGTLGLLAVGFAVVLLASMLTEIARRGTLAKLGRDIHRELAVALYRHVFRWSLSDFSRRAPGNVSALLDEVAVVRRFITGRAGADLLVLLHPIAYLAMLAWMAPRLVPVALLAMLFCLFVTVLLGRRSTHPAAQPVNRAASLETMLMEQIEGFRTTKAMTGEAQVRLWWQERLDAYLRQDLKTEVARLPLEAAMDVFPYIVTLIGFVLAADGVMAGEISVGAMIAGTLLVSQTVRPIAGVAGSRGEFRRLLLSVERIEEAFAHPAESPGADGQAEIAGDVEFRNATYRRGRAARSVLNGLDLVFRRGEITALVGNSGSGKSTIAQLMNGLLTLCSGTVTIGGVDAARVPLEKLRRAVGVVHADDRLFEDTILENVAFGSAQPPDAARVESACRHARIHDFVESLPNGYAARVRESGRDFSSGERQRLLLARILYRDPAVMVLDDVTSHFDPSTQADILNHLRSVRAGKTIVVITHRPDALAYVDRVVALDGGAVCKDLRISGPEARSVFETM